MFEQSPHIGPGTSSLTTHTIEIIILLLIAFILGWIVSRLFSSCNPKTLEKIESENKELKKQNEELENKLKLSKDADSREFQMSSGSTISVDSQNTDPKIEKPRKIKQDDLKIVEGIGPKISQLLNDAGIHTWENLADSSKNEIQAILSKAGQGYEMHDPTTWPEQAELLAKGKWEEFEQLTKTLKGGKRS